MFCNDEEHDYGDYDDDDGFHLNPVSTKRLLPGFVPKKFSEALNIPPGISDVSQYFNISIFQHLNISISQYLNISISHLVHIHISVMYDLNAVIMIQSKYFWSSF